MLELFGQLNRPEIFWSLDRTPPPHKPNSALTRRCFVQTPVNLREGVSGEFHQTQPKCRIRPHQSVKFTTGRIDAEGGRGELERACPLDVPEVFEKLRDYAPKNEGDKFNKVSIFSAKNEGSRNG